MKKYFYPIIALLLVLVSLFFATTSSIGIKYGRGNGKSKEIKSLQEFAQFCEYFNNNSNVNLQTEDGHSLFAQELFSSSSQQEEIVSFTYHERNVSNIKSSYQATYYNSGSIDRSSDVKISRQLDLYVSEGKSLYHSVGQIISSSYYCDEEGIERSGSYVDFDLWVYITNEFVAVRFLKYEIHGIEDAPDFTPTYGKWLDCGADQSILQDINDNNMSVLGRLSKALNNEDDFKKSGKKWNIKEDNFAKCLGYVVGQTLPEDLSGDFTLDLSNSSAPNVKIQYNYSDSNSESTDYSSYSSSASAYDSIDIVVEDINNTIIKERIDFSNLESLSDFLED